MDNPVSESRWLMNRIGDARWKYISASLFTLLSAGCFVIFSWYLSDFAATWLVEDTLNSQTLLLAFAFLGGRYALAHIASLLNHRVANSMVSEIKKRIYPSLLNDNRSDSVASTLLVTRVSDDLKPFFSNFIPNAVASVVVGVLLLVLSFLVEFWVGLTLLIAITVIPILMRIIGVGVTSLHQKHIHLFMKYSAVFYNRLQTVAEIVNLDNLNVQHRFLSEKSTALNKATTQVMKVAILSSALLELYVSIAIAGVAIYLGLNLMGIFPGRNYQQGYDFHIALFLLILAPYLFFYLRKFVSAYHDRNKALASAKLLIPLFEDSVEDTSADVDEKLASLSIHGLSFAYPDTLVKALSGIELELPSKGLVLVKGISGSGKSTLLKVLSGNLVAEEGEVSVNGNGHAWSLQWLKANSTYMNQYPFIFDGTLRYNVFLEREPETQEAYPEFLNKIIDKKEAGWNTLMSHNGKQLSGGEKQLVTLARMMLYPKPVAIMDEPTASLDEGTTGIILEQIVKMAEEKLVIIASHQERFETIASTVLQLNWGEQMQDV